MAFEYRVGDILELSCPYTEARVTGLTADDVLVEWPWWAVDPASDGVRWNGVVAVAAGPDTPGWDREVFRIQPAAAELDADSGEPATETMCRIGIPPTVVHVIAVRRFDPPRVTGWLPRPRREVVFLRAGQSVDPGAEDQGAWFDPEDDIPRRVELRFRPYAFLEIGDEIADAGGRAWRFGGPWTWQPFDGAGPDGPTWPLLLLTRDGDSDDAAAVDVTEATLEGSHDEELARWRELARLSPEEPDDE
ncbi:hypothetical protein ACWDUL_25600 [Nocardia niigatensis]|uniref:hypothetical protein n=1 Tax=Nocardia niigatensis TaxID=209249 RepID=UPI00030FFE18|nr:hypothetical protein [Nocardia niigatensis]